MCQPRVQENGAKELASEGSVVVSDVTRVGVGTDTEMIDNFPCHVVTLISLLDNPDHLHHFRLPEISTRGRSSDTSGHANLCGARPDQTGQEVRLFFILGFKSR